MILPLSIDAYNLNEVLQYQKLDRLSSPHLSDY